MVPAVSRGTQRRAIYLVVGIVAGMLTMVTPALLLVALPQMRALDSLRYEFLSGTGLWRSVPTASPTDILFEVLWLVLPAVIVILALYWLAVHRTHWAGYDEAAKWSRR